MESGVILSSDAAVSPCTVPKAQNAPQDDWSQFPWFPRPFKVFGSCPRDRIAGIPECGSVPCCGRQAPLSNSLLSSGWLPQPPSHCGPGSGLGTLIRHHSQLLGVLGPRLACQGSRGHGGELVTPRALSTVSLDNHRNPVFTPHFEDWLELKNLHHLPTAPRVERGTSPSRPPRETRGSESPELAKSKPTRSEAVVCVGLRCSAIAGWALCQWAYLNQVATHRQEVSEPWE